MNFPRSFISEGICPEEGLVEPCRPAGEGQAEFLPCTAGGAPARFLRNLDAWPASSLSLRLFFCSRSARQTSDSAQD